MLRRDTYRPFTPHPSCPQPQSRRRAFAQHLVAEAEQFGRAAARDACVFARAFHQALIFDEATEILLVQAHAGERFDVRQMGTYTANGDTHYY